MNSVVMTIVFKALLSPLLGRLQTDGQHHIKEAVASVGGNKDRRGDAGVELDADLLRRGLAQRIHQIAVVEADLQTAAVAADAAHILGFAVASLGGEKDPVMVKHAAHRAFQLVGDDTLTRSMLCIRALVSTVTVMGFFRGIAFL